MLANFATAQQIVSDIPMADSIVFTQTMGQQNFLLDTTLTKGDPAYPTLGINEYFDVAGIWLNTESLAEVVFECKLFGALVYQQKFADAEAITAGEQWSTVFEFDVPGVAPPATYYISFYANDTAGQKLWEVTTDFKF